MTAPSRREAIGASVLALAGVGLRLLFVAAFPTEPLSDFRGLVLFGVRLRDEGLAVPGWHWVQFSPGLPLILSALFRVFPRGVTATAREATAVATGLLPLLPFLIWRPILAFRWRLLAGALLALWPGQVMFSGVVAQENWTLLPAVALACLAVRRLRDPAGEGFPAAAGLLYVLAGAIRQELLVAMLPPALAAAGLPGPRPGRRARSLRLAAAAAVPLLALAAERRLATGRFAVTSEHGGLGVLGTLVPGSAGPGWIDPTLSIAAAEPGLLTDPVALRRATWRLSGAEARRRWRFHAFRAAVSALRLSVDSEAADLLWSLEAPGAQPAARATAASALARAVRPFLRVELSLISGLFVAALLLALRRRDAATLVLGAAALVELLVQVLFSPLGRLMVPVIALELLVLCLAVADLAMRGGRSERLVFPSLGLAFAGALLAVTPPLQRLAVQKDEAPAWVDRFPIAIAGGGGVYADCAVEVGRLSVLAGDRARVAAMAGSSPGGSRVSCRLPERMPEGDLGVDLEETSRGVVVVGLDGRAPAGRTPVPDLAWSRAPLGHVSGGPPAVVVLETRDTTGFGFGLVLGRPGAATLPRYRRLP